MRTLLTATALLTTSLAQADPAALDVQGHRGWKGRYPENSMVAFSKAIELGVTTVELDVHATRDHVLIVNHDPQLDPSRCVDAAGKKVPKRAFAELDYADLEGIDCGGQAGESAPIPRLDDVLDLVRGTPRAVGVSIEIKKPELQPLPAAEMVSAVVAAIAAHDLTGRATIQCFAPQVLALVAEQEPEIERAALVRKRSRYEEVIEVGRATILSPRHNGLRAEDVTSFQARGIRVIPWTVNDPKRIELIVGWGVDGILSDHPDRVLDTVLNQ
jgi:glycerophosphoryl diester phosphodiesterase